MCGGAKNSDITDSFAHLLPNSPAHPLLLSISNQQSDFSNPDPLIPENRSTRLFVKTRLCPISLDGFDCFDSTIPYTGSVDHRLPVRCTQTGPPRKCTLDQKADYGLRLYES